MARQIKQGADPLGPVLRPGADLWKRLVEEQAGSGLTQKEFCRQKGVSVHGLRHWKYRQPSRNGRAETLDREATSLDPAVTTPGFVPVEVVFGPSTPAPEPTPSATSQPGSGVEVLLPGGLRIGLRPGFDSSVLLEVVEVLGC
jgi:hypothetical protein